MHAALRSLAVSLCLAAPPLWAQTDLRPDDAARLDAYTPTAGAALLAAFAGGRPADVSALATALSGTPEIAFDESLIGDWRCRTLRLGGDAALTVYRPFQCRFSIGATGFDFEKLTGSERTRGNIQLRAGRAIYVGVSFTGDVQPPAYADLPADPADNTHPHIAIFERVSTTRARLIFPAPAQGGDLDVLELTR